MTATQSPPLESFLDALHAGDLSAVERSLQSGVSSNWRDADGCSALFYALERRNWAIAKSLLAYGADINATDAEGWTPLFWAAFNGYADVVSFLVAHRADPNIKTKDGEWALFWAAYEGHAEIVRLLLEGGARRDWIDADGRNVLQLARALRRKDIEEILRAAQS